MKLKTDTPIVLQRKEIVPLNINDEYSRMDFKIRVPIENMIAQIKIKFKKSLFFTAN